MKLEEFERAKMLLDRLIAHNPEVYGFLIQHGRALFELGEIQRAKAELELAIEKLAGDNELSQEPASAGFYQSEVLGL